MVTYHKIKPRTQEWYDFRQNGIGCSEIRTILYSDDYSDPLVLFYNKLGMTRDVPDNEAMFHGRNLEDYIATLWEYWDETKDEFNTPGYIRNMNEGKKIRRCRNVNAIVVNSKYPWMFANPDRMINKKGGYDLRTGTPLKKEGVLEIKTTEGYAANKWKFEIDPAYLVQLNGYLLILGLDYGEIAVLKNGRYLDVFPFSRNDFICEQIIDATHDFWYNHVLPARKVMDDMLVAELAGNTEKVKDLKHKLHSFEPPVSSSKAVEEFIKDNYHNDYVEIPGTQELFDKGVKDLYYAAIISELEKIKQQNKNEILLDFYHSGTEYYNFGEQGRMRYFIRDGNTKPQLGNNIKVKFDKDEIKNKVKQIV